MTEKSTSPDADFQKNEDSRTYSKMVGVGSIFVSCYAASGAAQTAGAMLLGYATAGAFLPLLAYVGVFAVAANRLKVHGKKLGWDIVHKDDIKAQSVVPQEPSVDELQKEVAIIEGDIEALTVRVREVSQKLHWKGPKSSADVPSQPRM